MGDENKRMGLKAQGWCTPEGYTLLTVNPYTAFVSYISWDDRAQPRIHGGQALLTGGMSKPPSPLFTTLTLTLPPPTYVCIFYILNLLLRFFWTIYLYLLANSDHKQCREKSMDGKQRKDVSEKPTLQIK